MVFAEKEGPSPSSQQARAGGRGRPRLVGRGDQLELLAAALADAQQGKGRVVCLGGEPGIGKTRLAEEVAGMARSAGLGVHYAWGYEGVGSPPFWLWTQLLRSMVSGRDLDGVRAQLVDQGEILRAVLPELGGAEQVVEPSSRPDMRFQMFDAVAQFVLGEARAKGQVVIVDDAHWADPSSLRMLEFFAREVPRAPLLLVVNSRDPGAEGNAALADALGSLARHDWVERLDLGGLEAPDVDALIRDVSAAPLSDKVVDLVQERAQGNPFFVKEMVRFFGGAPRGTRLSEDPAAPSLPDSIRGLVARRLESLPDVCRTTLRTSALVGQEPEISVVARVMQRAGEELLFELESAVDAQLVAVGTDRTLRFAHPLIRDVLVLELPPSVRSELHLQIGQVLEDCAPDAWASIATHFSKASGPQASRKAIEYGRRAAAAAMEGFAFEDAVRLYAQTQRIVAIGEAGEVPPESRAELLLESAAAHSSAGDIALAREDAVSAAAAARQLGNAAMFARAALQFSIGQLVVGTRIAAVSTLFEEALGLLERDDPLRGRVLAELAKFSLNPQDRHRAEALIEEALAGARRLDDPELLVWCLAAQLYVLWVPGKADQRIETADQIIARAPSGAPSGAVGFARNARILSLLEKGDLHGYSAGVEDMARVATEVRDVTAMPFVLRYRATHAMLEGRLDEAEQLCQEAFSQASEQGLGEVAGMNMAVLTFTLRQHQGRLAEIEALFASMAAGAPGFVGWTAALCVLYVELDRRDDAARVFEAAKRDAPKLVLDPNWLSNITCFVEACVYLQDREWAQTFYDLLAPYARCYVVVGNGDSALGSVSRSLGQLASSLSRWKDAEGHYEAAIAEEMRLGARPNLAIAQLAYAGMLADRGDAGDSQRAAEVLGEAEQIMRDIGMARSLERAERVRGRLGAAGPAVRSEPDNRASSAGAATANRQGVFVDEGDYWTVGIDGHRHRLRASKGLQQIARLLSDPRREFHVLDLAGQLAMTEISDVGQQLDGRSYGEYTRRLEDLRDGIAEASDNNDPTREAALREEADFIAREIARNVGIGGRARRTGTPAERARVNVTRTIAKTISRIGELEPALARVLERSVTTGTFCVYEPDPDSPVHWTL